MVDVAQQRHGCRTAPRERISTRPSWRMRAERNRSANPMRRRLRHFGSMANRGEPAEARRRLLQTIVYMVKTGIATLHAVDAAEPAQPIAGLRQRDPNLPGAALFGAPLERRHHAEREKIASGMVERLCRQGPRFGGPKCLSLRDIQSARGLH